MFAIFTNPREFQADHQYVESSGTCAHDSSDRPTGQGSPESVDSSQGTHYKNIVHLWEFLLELLANENCRSIITWSNANRMEFKIKLPDEVAKRWGLFKKTKNMTYDKLSRALRFYYSKGIIEKVPKQRLVYRFHKLPYKYEPGVTRSQSHRHRIEACIGQKDVGVTRTGCNGNGINTYIEQHGAGINPFIGQQQVRQIPMAPPSIGHDWSSAFTPVITPFRRSRGPLSFLRTPTSVHPALLCPDRVVNTSPHLNLRSRIIFPDDINPGGEQVKPVGPGMHMRGTSASSIPVSVIQRI